MSDTIIREWYFGCYAVLTGAIFAWIYDNLRLCRRLIHHNRIMVNLEDLLYWTWCFCVSFVLLYYGNHGMIRAFAVAGAALGMFLYSMTLGRIYVKWGYILISKVLAPFRTLGRFVKNRLTHAVNHSTIKIRACMQVIHRKGERARDCHTSRKTKKKTGISSQKK